MAPPRSPPSRPGNAVLPKQAPVEREEATVAVSAEEVAAQVAMTRPAVRAQREERAQFAMGDVVTAPERPSSLVSRAPPPEREDKTEFASADVMTVPHPPPAAPRPAFGNPASSAGARPAARPAFGNPASTAGARTSGSQLPQQRPSFGSPASSSSLPVARPRAEAPGVTVFSPDQVKPDVAPEPQAARTQFAAKAMLMSEDFNILFAQHPLQGQIPRVARIIPPDVDSTGGGKMARESIVLASVSGSGQSITVGFVDLGKQTGELRSMAYLARTQVARGVQLGFAAEEYEAFLVRAQEYFHGEGIKVRVVDEALPEAPGFAAAKPLASQQSMTPMIIAVAVATALLGIAVGYFLL